MTELYIHWNPSTTAFELGSLAVRWYSLCWCAGLLSVYLLMHRLFRQQKLTDEQFDPMFLYCFLGILIGARLGHCLFYEPEYFLHHICEMLLPIRETADPNLWSGALTWLPTGNEGTHWAFTGYEGLASHGGTLGLMLALVLYSRSQKINLMRVLDNVAIVTPVCACAIRLGNLMNSEIIGRVTDVPWAFVFERIDMYPRHPGQLYEAICYACFFFIGWWLYKRRPDRVGTGFFFGLCLVLIFSSRILIEFTKENQVDFENGMIFNMGQLLSVPFVLLGFYCMLGGKWCRRLGEHKNLSVVVLLLILFTSCKSGQNSVAQTQGTEQHRVVVAYVTSWTHDLPDPTVMTHINYAFGRVTPTHDGVSVDNPDRLRAIVELKRRNPNLKVLLSVGGWGAGGFSEMASNQDIRERFCASCAQTAKDFGLDGIDIDWEYPGSKAAGIAASPQDRENFTLLMKGLRKSLGSDLLVTLATAAMGNHYDFPAFMDDVDFVNMMTYDMGGAPRHHAPLYSSERFQGMSCQKAMQTHLDQGVPAGKLVLGLPFYGRGSKEVGDFVNFSGIKQLEGYTEQWDKQAQVPYLTNREGKVVLGYDNARSLKGKGKFARKHHLRGLMYWDYNGDDSQGTLRNVVWESMQ